MRTIILEIGKEYEYSGGAVLHLVTFIGKTSNHPDVKVGSSMGKGWLFKWEDGHYFELSIRSVRVYIEPAMNKVELIKNYLETTDLITRKTLKNYFKNNPYAKYQKYIEDSLNDLNIILGNN